MFIEVNVARRLVVGQESVISRQWSVVRGA